MIVLDPGHRYALAHIDGDGTEELRFVKREGPRYPGNKGHYPGTNIQEVLRVLIDRLQYLNNQDYYCGNQDIIDDLRSSLMELEFRAAMRHGRPNPKFSYTPELISVCDTCGHIECGGHE